MSQGKIGPLIRKARNKLGMTRVEAAKVLKISAGYVGHLERSAPVRLSEALSERLISRLGVSKKIDSLRPAHNRRSLAQYRIYRKKQA